MNNIMKTRLLVSLLALLGLLASLNPRLSAAPLGTAFTYQGQLTDRGNPANGNYDLQLTLPDSPAADTTFTFLVTGR